MTEGDTVIRTGQPFARGAVAELRPWTDAEVARLHELRAANLSRAECGERLGRSEGSIAGALRTDRFKANTPTRQRTPEREIVLRRDWPGGVQIWDIIARMNALPGVQITDPNTVSVWASALEIKRPGGFRVSRLYLGAWTRERDDLLTRMRADGASDAAIFTAINATPGEPLANENSIRRRVKTLNLPARPKAPPRAKKARPSRAKPPEELKRNPNGAGRKARPKADKPAPEPAEVVAAPVRVIEPLWAGWREISDWWFEATGKREWAPEIGKVNALRRKLKRRPFAVLRSGKFSFFAGRAA